MRISGALVTHYHPDHCGGSMAGFSIEGAAELLELAPVPIHVQADGVGVGQEGHRSRRCTTWFGIVPATSSRSARFRSSSFTRPGTRRGASASS